MKLFPLPFSPVRPFYEWLSRYPLLCAVTGVFLGILGGFDGGIGLRFLFLDPDPMRQFVAGFAAAFLLFEICFVGYLLNSDQSWMLPEPVTAESIGRYRVAYLVVTVGVLALAAIAISGANNDTWIAWPFSGGLLVGIVVVAGTERLLGDWLDRLYNERLQQKWRGWRSSVGKNNPLQYPLRLLDWFLVTPHAEQLHSIHLRGIFLGFLLLIMYSLLVVMRPLWVTTAIVLCVLLSLVAAIYGFIRYNFPDRFFGAFLAALLVIAVMNGLNPYPHRYREFPIEQYRNPVSLDLATEPNEKLISDLTALTSWESVAQDSPPGAAAAQEDLLTRPKLIVVSTSGGGIRAGVWTVNILTSIEQQVPDFPRHLRLVTGASGGMYGASYYVQSLNPPDSEQAHEVPLPEIVDRIAKDCLNDVAQEFVLRDIPHFLLGNLIGIGSGDRGIALEDAIQKHTRMNADEQPQGFAVPFSELAAGERDGWRPSLIISPMMADDGRRLLFSNLDLTHLTKTQGLHLESDSRYSVGGIEFFRLFPEVPMRLATAVRMNASFPYISPDSVLPTNPQRRIVDAGYYDNYGVNLAAAWLFHRRDWLAEHTSGVLLIEIRDSYSQVTRNEPAQNPSAVKGPLAGGFSWLTTPITAVMSARNSTTSFRNDEQIQALQHVLRSSRERAWKKTKKPGEQTLKSTELSDIKKFFVTTAMELNEEVSLSWTLTPEEISNIATSASRDEIKEQIRQIDDWLHQP